LEVSAASVAYSGRSVVL